MTPHEQLQAIQVESSGATRYVPGVGYLSVVSITEGDFTAMTTALRAVLDLHREETQTIGIWDGSAYSMSSSWQVCGHCEINQEPLEWPCPTVQRITEALT